MPSSATIYNTESKFDDASKMSAKANELLEAGGGTGDPTAGVQRGRLAVERTEDA